MRAIVSELDAPFSRFPLDVQRLPREMAIKAVMQKKVSHQFPSLLACSYVSVSPSRSVTVATWQRILAHYNSGAVRQIGPKFEGPKFRFEIARVQMDLKGQGAAHAPRFAQRPRERAPRQRGLESARAAAPRPRARAPRIATLAICFCRAHCGSKRSALFSLPPWRRP